MPSPIKTGVKGHDVKTGVTKISAQLNTRTPHTHHTHAHTQSKQTRTHTHGSHTENTQTHNNIHTEHTHTQTHDTHDGQTRHTHTHTHTTHTRTNARKGNIVLVCLRIHQRVFCPDRCEDRCEVMRENRFILKGARPAVASEAV